MKGLSIAGATSDHLKSANLNKIVGFSLIFIIFFFLGKHFNDVWLSDASNQQQQAQERTISSVSPTSSPSPPSFQRLGVVDEKGRMKDDFEVGEYDPVYLESSLRNIDDGGKKKDDGTRISVQKFRTCPDAMRDYIPCLNNEEVIDKLNLTDKRERFERHCPQNGKVLNCIVPAPKGYKAPIPWPRGRDEVWLNNVPYVNLAEDKDSQIWITIDKDKFKFPRGGMQFIHGTDRYLDQIEKMVPEIGFGHHTRVVLDVGCGVANFGAYLFSRNVITLSIGPIDMHENQVQFALERGVPAMLAAFATKRLLYPSQAFELIHCSSCKINWTSDVNLRLGPFSSPDIFLMGFCYLRSIGCSELEDILSGLHSLYTNIRQALDNNGRMINLTHRLCWTLIKKEGYLFIWQKPINNGCYLSREEGVQPQVCETDEDPDNVWFADLKACITRLPENGYGSNVTPWPKRLENTPDRLQTIHIDASMSREEFFMAESRYWKEIVETYVRALRWKGLNLRNVLDMRAGFGGFAAALIEYSLDCWVLNVVPVGGPNTLPVIYDRGLIGVMHDWCEPFDTYPRTYDLIHADGLFSAERERCNITKILLEMDRILRPGGRVYIRDSLFIMEELEEVCKALGWRLTVREPSQGPHVSERILIGEKGLHGA